MSDNEDDTNIPTLEKSESSSPSEHVEKEETNSEELVPEKAQETHDGASITKECTEKFSNYMTQFIDALCSVFPEDIKLNLMKTKLNLAIGEGFSGPEETRNERKTQMISKWHQVMSVHYKEIMTKNDAFVSKLKPSDFNGIDLVQKYNDPSIDKMTQECMLDYCKELSTLSQLYSMYNDVPEGVMDKISNAAHSVMNGVPEGQMPDISNIFSLGSQIAQDMSPNEMQNFTQSVMGNMSGLTSIAASMMGGVQPGGQSGGGGAGGIMSFMKMFMQ